MSEKPPVPHPSIVRDISQLGPLEVVEMFVLDISNARIQAPKSYPKQFFWHAGTKPVGMSPIVWQKNLYEAYPIESEGWQQTTTGTLPRPLLRVSNIGGQIGIFLRAIKDGLGAKVIRKRTLGKYLDAVNFPKGNAYANPNACFPDEIFYVARKVVENPIMVELELAVPFDVEGIMLPRRQVLATICPFEYRSPDCTYEGPAVQDVNGNATSDRKLDQCAKSLTACRARFGTGLLRFGGFPGSLLGRNV